MTQKNDSRTCGHPADWKKLIDGTFLCPQCALLSIVCPDCDGNWIEKRYGNTWWCWNCDRPFCVPADEVKP